jgi:hypothetical protein
MDQGAPATFGTSRVFWSQMCSSFNSCSSEAVRSVVLPGAKLQMREIEPQQPCGDESGSQELYEIYAEFVSAFRSRPAWSSPSEPGIRPARPRRLLHAAAVRL